MSTSTTVESTQLAPTLPLLAIAPMVRQSDSVFREFIHNKTIPLLDQLVSKTGSRLTVETIGNQSPLRHQLLSYTPMLMAHDIVNQPEFLNHNLISSCKEEQLILQLA
jgi:tRNA-dihydrouridine synthase